MRRCSRLWWLSSVAGLLLGLGCGGAGGGRGAAPADDVGEQAPDPDVAGAAEGEGEVPAAPPSVLIDPPAAAESPRFEDWTCPEGWSARVVEQGQAWEHSICEVSSPPDCEGAQIALPGDVVCRALGRPCDQPLSLEGVVIHVDPGAPAGGDGSRDAPLSDLTAALALPHAQGATVLLAAGEHPGALTIDRPLSLRGVCSQAVSVGPITITAAGPVVLDNLTVRSGSPSIAISATAADVMIEHVLIEAAVELGIRSDQRAGRLRLDQVVVRDTVTDNPFGSGSALYMRSSGITAVTGSVFEDCGGSCVFAGAAEQSGPGTLSITRSVVRRSLAAPALEPHLIRLWDGAGAVLNQTILEGAGSMAILIGQSGGGPPPLVTVTDCAIRDVVGDPEVSATGIGFVNAGRLVLTRTVFDRLGGPAVSLVSNADGLAGHPTADLSDMVVRDSVVRGIMGGGVSVEGAGSLHVRRSLFQRTGASTLVLQAPAPGLAKLHVEDVVIRDGVAAVFDVTMNWPGVGVERGITEYAAAMDVAGGDVDGSRIAILGQPRGALAIRGTPARNAVVDLSDLILVETKTVSIEFPDQDVPLVGSVPGQGVEVVGEAQVMIQRLEAEDLAGQLTFAFGDPDIGMPRVDITDIRATGFKELDGRTGLAVGAGGGAQVHLERVELTGARVMGVASFGAVDGRPTEIHLSHIRMDGTHAASCAALPADDPLRCVVDGQSEGGGIALLAREGGHLTASDFDVRGAVLAGAVVASGAQLELHRGVITGNAIGLNIMTDDQDLALLEDAVFVYDNDVDVARETLALPSLPGLVGGD